MMRFTVSDSSDEYAPEEYYVSTRGTLRTSPEDLDSVLEVQVFVRTLPTDAVLEMDLLQTGGDPETPAHWNIGAQSWNATGLATPVALSDWPGVRFRMKSGGTAGTGRVDFGRV